MNNDWVVLPRDDNPNNTFLCQECNINQQNDIDLTSDTDPEPISDTDSYAESDMILEEEIINDTRIDYLEKGVLHDEEKLLLNKKSKPIVKGRSTSFISYYFPNYIYKYKIIGASLICGFIYTSMVFYQKFAIQKHKI